MTPALAKLCSTLGIEEVPTTAYRRDLETCAVQTMENILVTYGEAHLMLVLRSIAETDGNSRELVAPTIWAVSDIIRAHPTWPGFGLRWLEAVDSVGLGDLRVLAKENRNAVPIRQSLASYLFLALRKNLGTDKQKVVIQ